jgi:hypothetical protein
MKDGYVIVTKHGIEIRLEPGPEGIHKKLDEVLAHGIP